MSCTKHCQPGENYSLLGSAISRVDEERDLGVVITADLKSSKQCIAAEQKPQKILGYITRVFHYRNKHTVLALYKTLVRPLLEYVPSSGPRSGG